MADEKANAEVAIVVDETESKPKPQPLSPGRRALLKLGALFAGKLAADKILPEDKGVASAEGPPDAPPIPPPPDQEKIKNEFMTREELGEKYQVKILDLPNQPDYIKLNFRQSAAESRFLKKQLEDKVPTFIVVVDGPFLDTKFLTEEQKAALPTEAIEKLEELMHEYVLAGEQDYARKARDYQRRYDEGLSVLRRDRDTGKMTQDQFNVSEAELGYKYLKPSREDILKTARGLTITPALDHTTSKYIFMPARDVPDKIFESGNEKIKDPEPFERHGQPTPYQSYPSPARFVMNPQNRIYPMEAGNTPSTDLRHEMEHAQGVKHPDTDYHVMSDITTAYQKYLNGDDSDFWVVWETPEGLTVSQKQGLGNTS